MLILTLFSLQLTIKKAKKTTAFVSYQGHYFGFSYLSLS